jgi:hypothetical protein
VTVTADGQHPQIRRSQAPEAASGRPMALWLRAHRLGVRTGLESAGPAELREVAEALSSADVVEGGPGSGAGA